MANMTKLFKELGINEDEYEILKERFLQEDSELQGVVVHDKAKNWFKRRYEEGESAELICNELVGCIYYELVEYIDNEIANIVKSMQLYIEAYRQGRQDCFNEDIQAEIDELAGNDL